MHAAPSDVPLNPAKHLQSINASLPDAELVPAGHVEHSPAPVAELYVPASHTLHSPAPVAALMVPASHALQCNPSDVAVYPTTHLQSVNSSLSVAEFVPAGHVEHSPAPVVALNVPSLHALHCNPSEAAVYPTTHWQSVNSSPPSAELVCEGHTAQLPDPAATLYVPASQAVHATPSDVPLYPAKHLQSINALLPDAELVPDGHAEHCPAPVASLYSPTTHAVHSAPLEDP